MSKPAIEQDGEIDASIIGNKWQSFTFTQVINQLEETLMKKFLLSSAIVAFTASSAFAQTAVTSEYYVVRDATTKKCTIVDNGVFKTRTEAETGMKTMKVCTEN